MNKNTLSFATITWARNEQEETLLRESLQHLAALQLPVFITDGGSHTSFLEFLRSVPNFTLLTTPAQGVWAQAKNSIAAAYDSGTDFIFYTEPDKGTFFRQLLPQMLREVVLQEGTGIVTASRSAAGFATFPLFQRLTETTINKCCAEVISKEVDYTYGPFLLNRGLAPYLNLIQQDIGWGWRPYIFCIAHRLNYKVDAFVADFSCPSEQREDNPAERIYRMRQLSQNIEGLVLSTGIILKQDQSLQRKAT